MSCGGSNLFDSYDSDDDAPRVWPRTFFDSISDESPLNNGRTGSVPTYTLSCACPPMWAKHLRPSQSAPATVFCLDAFAPSSWATSPSRASPTYTPSLCVNEMPATNADNSINTMLSYHDQFLVLPPTPLHSVSSGTPYPGPGPGSTMKLEDPAWTMALTGVYNAPAVSCETIDYTKRDYSLSTHGPNPKRPRITGARPVDRFTRQALTRTFSSGEWTPCDGTGA